MARLTNCGIIGKQVTMPSVSSASGKWNISENNIYRQSSLWPGDDPFAANVVFYLNGDSITDKTGRHSLTINGSAGQSTAVSPPITGGRSTSNVISVSSNASSYITVSNNLSDFQLNSDFTLEMWIYSVGGLNNYAHIFNIGGQTGNGVFKTFVPNSGSTRVYPFYFYSSNGQGPSFPDGSLPVNSWSHVVFERYGSTSYMYKDGAMIASTSSSYGPGGIPPSVGIGGPSFGSEAAQNYLDEIRFTRAAKYKGLNFTVRTNAYQV